MKANYEKRVTVVIECEHADTTVSYGDNISTTGPTGIYETCHKCGKKELVGHVGRNGEDVLYDTDEYRAKQARRRELQDALWELTD